MVNLDLIPKSDLWYVIGLIASDGNLSPDRRHLNITSKDKSLVTNTKKALRIHNKIGKKSSGSSQEKKYFTLQFGDVRFYSYLEHLGLRANKSKTLGEIKVPRKVFADFLRGIIDGDGNIHTWIHSGNGNRQWALRVYSASPRFVQWLKNEIENTFKVSGSLYEEKRPTGSLYTIKFGKLAAKVILGRCYYPNCRALPRKFQKAHECLQSRRCFKQYGNVITT